MHAVYDPGIRSLALRRIREAEETGAVELDLSGWNVTALEVQRTCNIESTSARLGASYLAPIALPLSVLAALW
jgi:hypothetical protein